MIADVNGGRNRIYDIILASVRIFHARLIILPTWQVGFILAGCQGHGNDLVTMRA